MVDLAISSFGDLVSDCRIDDINDQVNDEITR